MNKLIVLRSGMLSTIHSLEGRAGQQHLGIPHGGPMDQGSARLANFLVGNLMQAPVMEVTIIGPSLQFVCDCTFAICGGDLSPTLDGVPVAMDQRVFAVSGQTLRFGKVVWGCRAYLAVAGGFLFQPNRKEEGQVLVDGDQWLIGDGGVVGQQFDQSAGRVDSALARRFELPLTVTVERGPESDWFAGEVFQGLLNTLFRLTASSNRMAYRLEPTRLADDEDTVGNKLHPLDDAPQPMISSGVFPGVIQVPASGNPILLMRDAQTTGGYPRIAVVRSSELDRLAQLRPGDGLRFCQE